MISYKKLAIATLLGLGLLGTALSADADKGQRIYQKKLKSVCGETGAVFAAKNDQATWEEAKDNGTLGELMTEACPAGADFFSSDKFKNKYSSHLYDFVNKFASDSGNIPSC
jgi:hypothetical protein